MSALAEPKRRLGVGDLDDQLGLALLQSPDLGLEVRDALVGLSRAAGRGDEGKQDKSGEGWGHDDLRGEAPIIAQDRPAVTRGAR